MDKLDNLKGDDFSVKVDIRTVFLQVQAVDIPGTVTIPNCTILTEWFTVNQLSTVCNSPISHISNMYKAWCVYGMLMTKFPNIWLHVNQTLFTEGIIQ